MIVRFLKNTSFITYRKLEPENGPQLSSEMFRFTDERPLKRIHQSKLHRIKELHRCRLIASRHRWPSKSGETSHTMTNTRSLRFLHVSKRQTPPQTLHLQSTDSDSALHSDRKTWAWQLSLELSGKTHADAEWNRSGSGEKTEEFHVA